MVIRELRDDDFEAVFAAFVDAFSDYAVKLSPSREQLAEMLTRRGYVPAASVGVFDGERLVAFTLNGVDGEVAYDSGTGVVPSHRRQGLASRMLEFVVPRLAERGATRYVLEVIESNTAAIELYRKHRFAETRRFDCWRLECGGKAAAPESGGWRHRTPNWFDVEPSWQNSDGSIARAKEPHITIGDDDGFAILFPNSGDLAQLAVRRDKRRQGIGTRLVQQAAAIAGKPLRILNVDDRDRGIAAFLEANGAVRFIRQIEMALANFVLPPRPDA